MILGQFVSVLKKKINVTLNVKLLTILKFTCSNYLDLYV